MSESGPGTVAAKKAAAKRKPKAKEGGGEKNPTFDITLYVEEVKVLSADVLRTDKMLQHGQVCTCLLRLCACDVIAAAIHCQSS